MACGISAATEAYSDSSRIILLRIGHSEFRKEVGVSDNATLGCDANVMAYHNFHSHDDSNPPESCDTPAEPWRQLHDARRNRRPRNRTARILFLHLAQSTVCPDDSGRDSRDILRIPSLYQYSRRTRSQHADRPILQVSSGKGIPGTCHCSPGWNPGCDSHRGLNDWIIPTLPFFLLII